MPKRKRKAANRKRLVAVLATEAGLRCQLYRQGTKATCGNPATCFRPGLGDMCDDHPQAQGMIRYATERAASYRAGGNVKSSQQAEQHIERQPYVMGAAGEI